MSAPIEGRQAKPEGLLRARRTIVVVDVVESVRLIQAHEDDVIDRWRHFVHEVRTEALEVCGGRFVKSLGDGMLLEFGHTPRALAMAFGAQRRLAQLNAGLPEDRIIQVRIGLHAGDVLTDELDVYGIAVNLTARLAGVARPGGVAASEDAVDELLPGIDALVHDGGRCFLKHIEAPVQVYLLEPVVSHDGDAGDAASARPAAELQQVPQAALAPCIALIPIACADMDADQQTLTELAGDLLLTRLSTVPLLRVISRLSTEQFRVRGLGTRQIANHTGASYLLSGRLHGGGAKTLLFLELVDAHSEEVLWATSTRLRAEALLDPDEAVTPPIVQGIVDQIVSHELRRVGISPLPNLASQTLQFAAIHLMHRRSATDFERAHQMLEHLVDRHPRAAAPHAWLAKWHVLRVTKGWSGRVAEDGDRALDHTRRALDLNPDSAMAIAMEAFALCHMKRDLFAAQARLGEALSVDPNEPWTWLVSATVDSLLGHGEQAWQCAQRAAGLSPLDPVKHYYDSLAASAAVAADRYVDAERLARLALTKDPSHLPTLRALAIAQVHLGQGAAARETFGKVMLLKPDFTLTEYVDGAPVGGETMRRRWAQALREAGARD